jgi:uncharacterized protein DUF4058
MPSPFPGMDPFIEGQEWEDFHHGIIHEMRTALVPQVRPRYVVRVEERFSLDEQPDEDFGLCPPEWKQRYLSVKEHRSLFPVTVIEILSPMDKRPDCEESRRYQGHRNELLQSSRHLVELDLLRCGKPPPGLKALPVGDYRALVARAERRPQAEAYVWSLRQPLPSIPIPLANGDPDVTLDLQAVFTSAYDRAGYDYSLDYRRLVEPPLGEADAGWVQEILAKREAS